MRGARPESLRGLCAILIKGALSGWPNLSVALQLTTPLIFTGLAVAVSFRSGIWNIGVEGQMLMGALAAGIVGYAAPLPDALMHSRLRPRGVCSAELPGRRFRRCFASSRRQRARRLPDDESDRAAADRLYVRARIEGAGADQQAARHRRCGAPDQFLALLATEHRHLHRARRAACSSPLFNAATVRGFEWKIIGLNPRFAHYGGVASARNVLGVMLASGAIAGSPARSRCSASTAPIYDNFSPGYGFDGIAVAMLANSNPIGVILSSFLFGALNSGARCCRCRSASANISSRCCSSSSC